MVLCANNAVGFVPLLSCANDITQGLFGLTIVAAVFAYTYFRSRTTAQPRDAVAAASFISLLVAVLLRILGALDDKYLAITLVLVAGSAAVLAYRQT